MACGSLVQYSPIFDVFKVKVDCLQHAIGHLCTTIFAGVNLKGLSFIPLELNWYFIIVLLDRVIALKLIHAICIFDTNQGSHIFLFLGSNRTCKITLLFVYSVLQVVMIKTWFVLCNV